MKSVEAIAAAVEDSRLRIDTLRDELNKLRQDVLLKTGALNNAQIQYDALLAFHTQMTSGARYA